MNIVFSAFTKEYLKVYYKWCETAHVKEIWFRDGYEPKEKILEKIGGIGGAFPFIIKIDNKPVGYIQYYMKNKNTAGFDIFIGEEDYVGKGYGTKVVKAFADKLFALHYIKKVIVDPFANDKRAIKCYKKAGFSFICNDKDEIGTDIYLMEKQND